MIKKFLKILKYYLSFIIIANINICRYLLTRSNLENHNILLETQPQHMRDDLQKMARQYFNFLLISHIKPDDINMYDLEQCEVQFLWDSSRLFGLKYLFDEITYLLFFPRNPRTNKFKGYEHVPQNTKLVIIKFIKNDIDNIWIQRDKEIINLADEKLQTKDIQ